MFNFKYDDWDKPSSILNLKVSIKKYKNIHPNTFDHFMTESINFSWNWCTNKILRIVLHHRRDMLEIYWLEDQLKMNKFYTEQRANNKQRNIFNWVNSSAWWLIFYESQTLNTYLCLSVRTPACLPTRSS